MQFNILNSLNSGATTTLPSGPLALLLIEDDIEVASTIAHLHKAGFAAILAFCDPARILPDDLPDNFIRVDFDVSQDDAVPQIVNQMIKIVPGQWLFYCFNAEYLFYPFCEHRSVGEMLGFVSEERRDTVMSYVIDLYPRDLQTHPNGVCLEAPYFDKSGYYALGVEDEQGNSRDRQVKVSGGLRWRFEEHIAPDRQRADRISFFRALPGLKMLPGRSFNAHEYNTYSCPWHHSPTAAICSFRTAKALRRNPGSRSVIHTFHWPQSTRFTWTPEELLDLGMMEPGQWF